jgi:hydrogenase expression/formation protein HypE
MDDGILSMSCPLPLSDYPEVTLAHGGGGSLMNTLIEKMMLSAFGSPEPGRRHDGAVLDVPFHRIVFTTDSYVIDPLFFPGGDIGSLAVYGTVNDLAVCGATPMWLSAGFILEEGFPMEDLWRVVRSMAEAARNTGVAIVTGDTKVVDRGKGDGLFLNTAGVGVLREGVDVSPGRVRPGDSVILSGDIGRHGISIMALREGIALESDIESDLAPLCGVAEALLAGGVDVHCMRDLTRGGLASSLNEIAISSGTGIRIEEDLIPVREDVKGACEILGFDPLYVANEGRLVLFADPSEEGRALDIMRQQEVSSGAVKIGTVLETAEAPVTMQSLIGTVRIVDVLSGEQLPRIC